MLGLCTSGYGDDVVFSHKDYMEACRLIQLQRVTSLRRRVRANPANASAASYWLRRVLDDDGH